MKEIIECNPQILGGKPIIKGTRIPVSLIFELIGLNYSLEDIKREYPSLSRKILIKIIELGQDAKRNLIKIDLEKILQKEAI